MFRLHDIPENRKWQMDQARHSKGQQHPFLYRPYSEKWKHLHLYSKGIQRFPAGFLQHHRIEDHPGLTAPTLSSLTNTKSGRTNVKWKKVTAASGYQVEYSTSKNFTNSKRISTGNSSSTALSGLKKGKTYYIRVRACKKSNGITSYSPWSNTKSIKIKK